MKVGILGTRGIPNRYGGFEQFAEYLAEGLLKLGVDVWVYNSHDHPYQEKQWNGVNLIHCYDPEKKTGIAGQFIYDLNCILDSRKRKFDILLQLGYTSSSIWCKLLPANARIITNMDGLEWNRSKYNRLVRLFLKYAEKLAVNSSHLLIADSEAIAEYLLKSYDKNSVYIPYGADVFDTPDPEHILRFNVLPYNYFLVIARMQPDNHIEEIINGVIKSNTEYPLLIIGNTQNKHGEYLKNRYESGQIRFLGSIFEKDALNQLRYYSKLYFHGHSAGGTNPSLLEAMAAQSLICAHDNIFNRSVLDEDAGFFADENDIANLINQPFNENKGLLLKRNNLKKIKNKYVWSKIIQAYFETFKV